MNQRNQQKFVLLALTACLNLIVSTPPSWATTKFEQFSTAAEKAYAAREYAEAERNFLAALKESDKLEKGDKRPATTVYNLALVYQAEGKYGEAEQMYEKAKEQFIQLYGAEHQRIGQVYLDLADLYVQEAGEDSTPDLRTKAADNYKKAIAIFEKIYAQATGQIPADPPAGEAASKGPENAGSQDAKDKKGAGAAPGKSSAQEAAGNLAGAIKSLASFHAENDEFAPAEPLYKRMLELEEYAVGPEDKQLIKDKATVAEFYCVQGKYKPAAPLFKDALAMSEKVNGPDSEETAQILYNYGGLHYDEGSFADAEKNFRRAIKIFEKTNHDENDLAMKSIALADVLDMQSKPEEAHTVYKKTIESLEKNADPSGLIQCLKQYQKHLLIQNNKAEAGKVAARIKELKANAAKQAQGQE